MNYAWGVEFVEVDPTLLGTEKVRERPAGTSGGFGRARSG
jgi:hypothetical protein